MTEPSLRSWRRKNGKPICPRCQNQDKIYEITTRNKFKCGQCHHQFSATSGSLHHARKASLEAIEIATKLLRDNPGISVAEIRRATGMSYRGAYYLIQRIKNQEELTPCLHSPSRKGIRPS